MARILVVDDDPDWCGGALTRPLSALEDCQVITVQNRNDCKTQFEESSYDLVILNIRLDMNIKDANIITQWIELLELLVPQGCAILVVTSRSFPPTIQIDRLIRMAFRDYGVADFLIKEDFLSGEYRSIVEATITKRRQMRITLRANDRKDLINMIANIPSWLTGNTASRMGWLLESGLPSFYVRTWDLSGIPGNVAARVVAQLEGVGEVVNAPGICALGLVVKHLHDQCADIEGRRFYVRLSREYDMIRNPAWALHTALSESQE